MERFIRKTTLFLLPSIIILVAVNYIGDAANLYSKSFEEKVSGYMLDGYNVSNVYNYNERTLQKKLVMGSTSCPEVLVLGSSRTMLISADFFPERSFFNSSVSGATVQDIVGLWKLYEEKGCRPKQLIMAFDPWTLNDNNGQERWQTLSKEYNAFLREVNLDTVQIDSGTPGRYGALISPSYFQNSLAALVKGAGKPVATHKRVNKSFTRVKDGSIAYDSVYRTVTAAGVEKRANQFIARNIYSIEDFTSLSPGYTTVLQKFLTKLSAENVEVVIVLIPYHPIAYSHIVAQDKYREVVGSEEYIRRLAATKHLKTVGSFSPDVVKIDGSFFYDGMHLNEKGIRVIMDQEKALPKDSLLHPN